MNKKNHNTALNTQNGFLILDFGSQYTWLIARSFRELGFYSQVEAFDFPLEKIKALRPVGIVLSGGPASVLSLGAPSRDLKALLNIAPLMGICYGLQLLCHQWGGKISHTSYPVGKELSHKAGRAYGASVLNWNTKDIINRAHQRVWMSHGDLVSKVPTGFSILARTEQKSPAVLRARNILALQFHPEVSHTEDGKKILTYFAESMCGAKKNSWTPATFLSLLETQIKQSVKDRQTSQVLCALSGGVDSTVMACFLNKVLGSNRVCCVFVDTGLLRKNEYREVLSAYQKMGLNVQGLLEEERFLSALKGITDPEQKRKVIGHLFIDIFKEYKDKKVDYLAQGTLYPDVIESISVQGPAHTIKSHHNVGRAPL